MNSVRWNVENGIWCWKLEIVGTTNYIVFLSY
jgi:hypothetical protein